ncbi:hypothetical protein GR160_05205 [Flavobacterium sp. Sd200]|uniref:hypothetical protein n=1 Tax=Flavobacterium sp. Sd200 TaxID=2692211 RepID=UPI00136D56E0|nr:hypothetical protein [Flavobacterium sp. Sd200]MXN90615.1 hypothetical protein [Flavobacterium sp. Sd200]
MKALYTILPAIVLLYTSLTFVSCGMSQEASGPPDSEINVGNPVNNRTSSDMNISPANVTTSDPAIKMQDTLTSPKGP